MANRLSKIYTRTGDKGTTGLGDGSRVPKSDKRIIAMGGVDETNAALGMVRALFAAESPEVNALDNPILARIQNDLFDLGADLCVPESPAPRPFTPIRLAPEQVARLEQEAARLNDGLPPLTSFILPAGSLLIAHLHQVRTLARRAERSAVILHEQTPINPTILLYLNRLSDLLFIMVRRVGQGQEVL